MTIEEGVASIILWFCSIGLAALLVGLYRRQRIDRLRHHLFVARDKLFDLARGGSVGFDDKAYRLLRDEINDLLRYAHKLRTLQLLAAYMLDDSSSEGFDADFLQSLDQISDREARTALIAVKLNIAVTLALALPLTTLLIFAMQKWSDRNKGIGHEKREEYKYRRHSQRRFAIAAFFGVAVMSPDIGIQDEWQSTSSQVVLAHASRQARQVAYS